MWVEEGVDVQAADSYAPTQEGGGACTGVSGGRRHGLRSARFDPVGYESRLLKADGHSIARSNACTFKDMMATANER